MPYTKKFKEMLEKMKDEYGKKKGEQIAHATAEKRGWRH